MEIIERYHLPKPNREKNTIFGLLASLSHNMLMFDQQKVEVRDMMTKFSKLCLISDDQTRSLLVTPLYTDRALLIPSRRLDQPSSLVLSNNRWRAMPCTRSR
jgi:hypothetical protein